MQHFIKISHSSFLKSNNRNFSFTKITAVVLNLFFTVTQFHGCKQFGSTLFMKIAIFHKINLRDAYHMSYQKQFALLLLSNVATFSLHGGWELLVCCIK